MNDDSKKGRDLPEWLRIAAENPCPTGGSLPVPCPNPLAPYEDLWFPAIDPIAALAITDSGGTPLYQLPEETAVALFRRWFRYHGGRYEALRAADYWRGKMRRDVIDGDPKREGS
jgi:hypothetical protein